MRRDLVEGMVRRQRTSREPGLQLQHLLREIFGSVRERIQCPGRQLIRPRRAADAKVDPAWRDRFENTKLLGNLERGVVGKHYSCAADANASSDRRDRRHENLRRGADDTCTVVMLRYPITMVTEGVAELRQRERFSNSGVLRASFRGRRLVQDRPLHGRSDRGAILRQSSKGGTRCTVAMRMRNDIDRRYEEPSKLNYPAMRAFLAPTCQRRAGATRSKTSSVNVGTSDYSKCGIAPIGNLRRWRQDD